MMQRVLHGATGSLGVVLAIEVVAAAGFEDDAFFSRCGHFAATMSNETMTAALAMMFKPSRCGLGISSPP